MSAYKIQAWRKSDPEGKPHIEFESATWEGLTSFFRSLGSRPAWDRMAITDKGRTYNPDRTIMVQRWADVPEAATVWADSDPLSRARALIFLLKPEPKPEG